MQYDVDLLGSVAMKGRICYRIQVCRDARDIAGCAITESASPDICPCLRGQVQDDVTGDAATPLAGCLAICPTLVPFHNPDGYCLTVERLPSATSRPHERQHE